MLRTSNSCTFCAILSDDRFRTSCTRSLSNKLANGELEDHRLALNFFKVRFLNFKYRNSISENFADITKEEAFEKTVELAFKNLLGKEKDIDSMSEDEIRSAVRMYFSRVDLMPGSPGKVFPLRIPDAVLTGSLYSTHINTYLHYFTQDQMLYLDATELIENPGMSLRRVADFAGVPQLITEENFYFDEEKGNFSQ